MTIRTPTEAVMAMGRINFTGNVIPASWWQHIRLPSGRPDQTAITLLSEIVYWYRPAEVRDEFSGALVGYRKRFNGDKLQRSYQAFADQFGFSKRETTDALKRLRNAGLITLDLLTVKTAAGSAVSNVLFVGVIPDAIAAITNSFDAESDISKNGTAITLKRNTPSVETEHLLRPDVEGLTLKRDTYTEITTEITTENKNTIGASAGAAARKRSSRNQYSPEFETAWQAYPKRSGGNSKSAAFKAWNARLKEGVTPQAMTEGVERYAAYVLATGNTGTQYVKQAATFFGPDCHFEEAWLPPVGASAGHNQLSRGTNHAEPDTESTANAAVKRIRAARAQKLAGRGQGVDVLGSHGGNIFEPLGNQERFSTVRTLDLPDWPDEQPADNGDL